MSDHTEIQILTLFVFGIYNLTQQMQKSNKKTDQTKDTNQPAQSVA
mgnify:CR=1 FL=1